MLDFIDDAVEQLIAANVATAADFRGMTVQEVDALEASLHLPFPHAFREFLFRIGRNDRYLFQGTSFSLTNVLRQTMRAAESLEKCGLELPHDACVIYRCAGNVFGYFRTTEEPDPPVYEISEQHFEPLKVHEHFSAFVTACVANAIARHHAAPRHPVLSLLGLIVAWELFYIGPVLALLGLKSCFAESNDLKTHPVSRILDGRIWLTAAAAVASIIGAALLLWVYKFQYSMQTMFIVVTVCAVCLALGDKSIGFLLLLAPFVAFYGILRSTGQKARGAGG